MILESVIAPPQAKVLALNIRSCEAAVQCCDTAGADEVAGPGTLLGDLPRPLPGHQSHDTPQLPAQRDTRLPFPGVLPGHQPVSTGHRSGKRVSSAIKYSLFVCKDKILKIEVCLQLAFVISMM